MNMESNRIAEVCRAKRISKKRAIQRTAAVGFGAIASISGAFALNDNAHAARPEGSNPANQGTSITIAETRSTIANSSVSTLVTFAVSANVRPKDEQYVWVRNSCTIAGQMVSVEYQPVDLVWFMHLRAPNVPPAFSFGPTRPRPLTADQWFTEPPNPNATEGPVSKTGPSLHLPSSSRTLGRTRTYLLAQSAIGLGNEVPEGEVGNGPRILRIS